MAPFLVQATTSPALAAIFIRGSRPAISAIIKSFYVDGFTLWSSNYVACARRDLHPRLTSCHLGYY